MIALRSCVIPLSLNTSDPFISPGQHLESQIRLSNFNRQHILNIHHLFERCLLDVKSKGSGKLPNPTKKQILRRGKKKVFALTDLLSVSTTIMFESANCVFHHCEFLCFCVFYFVVFEGAARRCIDWRIDIQRK